MGSRHSSLSETSVHGPSSPRYTFATGGASQRSNSFLDMKHQLHRQPSSFTRDDSTLGAVLRQVLFHDHLGPQFRQYARRHEADENILFIDSVTRYRQGSEDTNENTCKALWYQFIATGAPNQINISGSRAKVLHEAFTERNYDDCLSAMDELMKDCLDDLKRGDLFRNFLLQNESAVEFYATFNHDLLLEWLERGKGAALGAPPVVWMLIAVHGLKELEVRRQRIQLTMIHDMYLDPDGLRYIGPLAGSFKRAFHRQDTGGILSELIRVVSMDEVFMRRVRAEWHI